MSVALFRIFSGRKASAPVARERLLTLLAQDRGLCGQSNLLGLLRDEIVNVISRHVQLDPEKVTVRIDRGKTASILAVDVELPNGLA
jgi:cell division topological specificity factor